MSDQLDRLFERIDALDEETPEGEKDAGTIGGVLTAPAIKSEQIEDVDNESIERIGARHSQSSYVFNSGEGTRLWIGNWEPRVSVFQTSDHEYERYVSAATRIYSAQGRLADMANLLNLTLAELDAIRHSSEYMAVVRARIEAVGVSGLKARARSWVNMPKSYSGYYRIGIRKVRQILNDIDPEILEIDSVSHRPYCRVDLP